jgi:hypothetical protein
MAGLCRQPASQCRSKLQARLTPREQEIRRTGEQETGSAMSAVGTRLAPRESRTVEQ